MFEGESGGDEGAATGSGFDDDGGECQAGDDAVAGGEGVAEGFVVDGQFADEAAVVGDAGGEVGVFGWVDFSETAAEHGDGSPVGTESAAVGFGVDAAGETGDDGEAGGAELMGES